ncbi:MAG TPA: hypothetical protein PKD11_15020 [Pyrinomonadaceae bacterium]|nr:hypothetical protein [Pyrinomonadaceae bacterium]
MMKLAYRVFIATLTLMAFMVAATAQTTDKSKRLESDDRNTAPTVGTGGPVGGPTGLFTVYDGQTLRRGEFTLSAAYSNFDRDPGNVDITEIPVSFQVGLSNYFEMFFNTDAYRGIKVNSPHHLSGFYLPNSALGGISPAAIIYAPQGPTPGPLSGNPIFRPAGTQPFVQYPYFGGSTGGFGSPFPNGPLFGFPVGQFPQIGPAIGGGGGRSADNFPGLGSIFGSILPGVVLQTTTLAGSQDQIPTVFTLAPSYLPDAPLLNRTWGTSAFSTYTVGGKWRWTNVNNPVGFGMMGAYRWYQDSANNFGGFNQLQRGASAGGSRGDFLLGLFADARLARWFNVSGNVGYHINSSIKGDFPGGEVTLLDRPDELLVSAGVDFPVNKYFQPIIEFRSLRYVGGRTVNAFENHPMDLIAGFRIFPVRYFGMGFAYRMHLNQQGNDYLEDESYFGAATVPCVFTQPTPGVGNGIPCTPITVSNSFTGRPPGFTPSQNPHGFIFQTFIGRRNIRQGEIVNIPADVRSITLSDETITGGCPPGTRPAEGQTCNDSTTINVSTSAFDPEGDVLTYNYTVSGGRIIGTGANVQWDVSGLAPGTYTITAAVDDGCGFCGQTQTRTITIAECQCEQICECPTLSVTGPPGVTNPGDAMTFTANVVGGQQVTYNWSISGGGTIESGQGTPSIRVRTSTADADRTITATVNIGGLDPSCRCDTTASDSGPVAGIPEAQLIDEFGRLANDDVRARLDAFFVELQNNPTNQGYIINYGSARDVAARERLINNHIAFRRFDRSRITMVRGGDLGTGVNTRLYRVPPGAQNPNP